MDKKAKFKVIISAPYLQDAFKSYSKYFKEKNINTILPKIKERLSEKQLLNLISDIDGIICGDDFITKKVLEKANKLKVIVKWGTGIDSIDVDYANEKNIRIFNTPNAFSEPVSDTVLGYILLFARNLLNSDKLLKNGLWKKIRSKTLVETSVGIIGVGNVGSLLARKCILLGMKVYGNDIRKINLSGIEKIEMVHIDELLKKSDYVSLNCDLNKTSYHLIDRVKIKLMKKSSYLINTSRGSVISEIDLISALEDNIIKGAALDVFENEPLLIYNPLRYMENCLLSAHNANSSLKYHSFVHKKTIDMLYKGLGI